MTTDATQIDHAAEEAARLLSALGAAWSTYRLYPNPVDQPAFVRAVDALASFEGSHLPFEVGAGIFAWNGEPLEARRDGVERLATQLYIHDVATLRLARPPSAQELADFFGVIDGGEAGTQEQGGIDIALEAAGVFSLAVERRGLLGRQGEESDHDQQGVGPGEDAGLSAAELRPVAELAARGGDPAELAAQCVADSGGDPQAVADEFVSAFGEVHPPDASYGDNRGIVDALAPYWVDAQTPPIVVFAGAFEHLAPAAQSSILAAFLDSSSELAPRLFLDQLSGAQLAALAPHLEERSRDQLRDYVRGCLDRDDGEIDELLPLLAAGSEIRDERGSVAGRLGALVNNPAGLLAVSGETFDMLHDGLTPDNHPALGVLVLRGLFACEHRDHRFRRLLRIVSGRVAAAVRAGEFAAAVALLAGVRDDGAYPRERAPEVDAALGKLLSPELLTDLVERYSDEGESEGVVQLLSYLGPSVAAKLVDALATEESPALRRPLIELVGAVGTKHPQPLIAGLGDPRWFVARNLATALGRTGRPEAVDALRAARDHSDYRVRGEAMRSLVRLLREQGTTELVAALRDVDERVRDTALGYLRTGEFAGVDTELAGAVGRDEIAAEALGAVVEILARLGTPAAVEGLEAIAGRKFALRSGDRAVRQAAKDELKRLSR